MKQVTVAGAGKIGSAIAELLHHGGYGVTLLDCHAEYLNSLKLPEGIACKTADIAQGLDPDLLKGQFAVLSALPF
ncbi:3-hydroxyacyl-CoA dehydrogenase NAD-binding domain-containing protein, partial [Gluconobacter oxydans]|uniref:3-hydroxyacyl-CoA dehydrogenase NAD-binding domain-containing protein n=1 Tax=Gluconobacter oxydans TaxID=442 RepID=UPI0039E73D14